MVFAADYKRNYKNRFQGSRMTFQSPNGNRLVIAGKTGRDLTVNIVKFLDIQLKNVLRSMGILQL